MRPHDDDFILFIGDSITDANRDYADGDNLGTGYANFIAAWLTAAYPNKGLRFANRGINGNLVTDLQKRWQKDCLELKPDVVSILIGINDTYHDFDGGDGAIARAFEATYPVLLDQTRSQLSATLIICEPFLLPVAEEQHNWRIYLDHKITVARQMAWQYQAIYVPLDGVFAAASVHRPMAEWLPDGVHPSQAGHALIAQHWLHALDAL